MLENFFIEKCIKDIEGKLQWGKREHWKHADYLRLSVLIYEETGILLSNSSLKRVFGKIKNNHIPQIETRNALAKFAGYSDWNDFVSKHSDKNTIFQFKRIKIKKIVAGLSIGVVFTGLIIFLILSKKNAKENPDIHEVFKIQFSSHIIAASSPHTVVFNYNIKGIKDSVFIDYDDEFHVVEYELLPKERNIITHFYRFPNLYRVKLFTRDSVLAVLNIMLESPEWSAFHIDKTHGQFENLELNEENDGFLEIDHEHIKAQGIDIKTYPNHLMYCNISDYNINIDNSTITLKALHKGSKSSLLCFTYGVTCVGELSEFTINFSIENCYIRSFIKFDDYYLEDGHYSDLSALGLNFNDITQLELKIENNIIKIFKDSLFVTERQYYRAFGELKGIILNTEGYWQTREITIQDEVNSLRLLEPK